MMFASALPAWKICLHILLIKWENTNNIVIVDAMMFMVDSNRVWFSVIGSFSTIEASKKEKATNWRFDWSNEEKKQIIMLQFAAWSHFQTIQCHHLQNNKMQLHFVLWLVWKRKKNSILPVCALTKKLCAISKWACSNLNKMLLLRGRVVN